MCTVVYVLGVTVDVYGRICTGVTVDVYGRICTGGNS
jgi:hypothetical protein